MQPAAQRQPSAPADARESLRFAGWELHPETRELLIAGAPARIGARAFQLLLVLAQRAGRVVHKAELFALAWPGRVVEDNNLTVQITALRKLLGHEVIANVPGVGYRLTVQPLAAEELTAADASPVAANALTGGAAQGHTLLGRDEALAHVEALLPRAPLVTLVGPGGVGKTALARALAARRSPRPADGVHWIDLAGLRSGAALTPQLHQALGVHHDPRAGASDSVLALATRRAFVVLDNCEHLLDEVAAWLTPLLTQAPGLRWLCTSQEPLRLTAESVLRLQPLAAPGAELAVPTPEAWPALALLCRRAEQSGHDGHWDAASLQQAAELCRRLDGLPLALEIAAARIGSLGLPGVLAQIDQRLRLRLGSRDAPARHHSLLQTYEWSYSLLEPIQQQVFRLLAPFADGFDVELLRMLSAPGGEGHEALPEWDVIDALNALVEKSLVQREPGPGGRLRLLDSAREFARMQLSARSELERAHEAHAETMARWYATAWDDLETLRDAQWSARYMPHARNLQGALRFAGQKGSALLQALLVTSLGLVENFAQTASELIALAPAADALLDAPMPWRARALLELAWAHNNDGNREHGSALGLQALQDFEAAGDTVGAFQAITRLIRMFHGRPGQQQRMHEMGERLRAIDPDSMPLRTRLTLLSSSAYLVGETRSLERLQALRRTAQHAGLDGLVGVCLVNITDELMVQGRDEEVVDTAREYLTHWQGLPRRRALVCHNLALSLVRLGRASEAREPARVLLRCIPGLGYMVMDLFALAATQEGRHEEAALIAGRAAAIKRERDLLSESAEAAIVEATLAALQDALGMQRRDELMQIGAGMADALVLQLALPD